MLFMLECPRCGRRSPPATPCDYNCGDCLRTDVAIVVLQRIAIDQAARFEPRADKSKANAR